MRVTTQWTVDEEEYMRTHFLLAGAIQCARILGRNVRSVSSKAQAMGLTQFDTSPLTLRLLALASRPMMGCRTSDLPDVDRGIVGRNLGRLVKQKRLVHCLISYRDVRYFTTEALAEQMKLHRQLKIPKTHHAGVTIRAGSRVGWGPDDPMVITERTVFTICPAQKLGYRTNTHAE